MPRLHAHGLRGPRDGSARPRLRTCSSRARSASSSRAASGRQRHLQVGGDEGRQRADVALAVPDATNAYRQAVQRGARGVVEPHWVEDDSGRVELAAIATYGDNIHTFVNRSEYSGRVSARVRVGPPNGAVARGSGSSRSTTSSVTSSSAAWTSGSTSTRASSASRSSRTSRTRTSRPSTPRSCRR